MSTSVLNALHSTIKLLHCVVDVIDENTLLEGLCLIMAGNSLLKNKKSKTIAENPPKPLNL